MKVAMGDVPGIVISSMERAPWGWVLTVTVILALIKTWPIIQLQVLNARAVLRGEERSDLHNCNEKVKELDGRLTETIARVHAIEMKLFGTVAAYRILEADTELNSPGSPALIQARAVFREVWDTMAPVPSDIMDIVAKARRNDDALG